MNDVQETPEENKPISRKRYFWVALLYILAEIIGFLYALSFAHWRGETKEVEVYTIVRILLFFAALSIYIIGNERKSNSLKKQGGCFLIGNLIVVGLLIYLLA